MRETWGAATCVVCFFFFFVFCFFQAEDGIRDTSVTGVQTCALPIYGLSELLGRKYSILQQQANAQTSQAGAAVTSANAAAGLDRVKTQLLPGETAAGIGLTNARAGLTGEQRSEERRVGKEGREGGAAGAAKRTTEQ